jgi:hypothetical protein
MARLYHQAMDSLDLTRSLHIYNALKNLLLLLI